MDLKENWEQIRIAFDSGLRSSLHCAIATVGADGYPHITPIGFAFLRDDQTVYYFEEYTKAIPRNLEHNPRVCLMLVNSSRWFWGMSLYKGRFASLPGIRLIGVAGSRRPATLEEKASYKARVRRFRNLKGYELIWSDLNYVRDIRLERAEPVSYPHMTEGLWK